MEYPKWLVHVGLWLNLFLIPVNIAQGDFWWLMAAILAFFINAWLLATYDE